MELWNDGRSGPAGCLAGNLVLARIRDEDDEVFAQRKGTTFLGRGSIWIARMCATDAYLFGRDRHWANLSLEQHREVAHEAELAGQSVMYLFITALQGLPAIHYWVIPSKVIDRVAFGDPSLSNDFVYSLHIREDEGRFVLDREDVTQYHRVLELNSVAVTRLERAFEKMRQRKERRALGKSDAGPSMANSSIESRAMEQSEPRHGKFEIPLKGGRTALLQLPLPAAEVDLHRIKGWIDLMNDVLTETLENETGIVQSRRSRATQAVAQLQETATQNGTDQLTDAEIEEEIKSVRRG